MVHEVARRLSRQCGMNSKSWIQPHFLDNGINFHCTNTSKFSTAAQCMYHLTHRSQGMTALTHQHFLHPKQSWVSFVSICVLCEFKITASGTMIHHGFCSVCSVDQLMNLIYKHMLNIKSLVSARERMHPERRITGAQKAMSAADSHCRGVFFAAWQSSICKVKVRTPHIQRLRKHCLLVGHPTHPTSSTLPKLHSKPFCPLWMKHDQTIANPSHLVRQLSNELLPLRSWSSFSFCCFWSGSWGRCRRSHWGSCRTHHWSSSRHSCRSRW